jgi:hypothetical protein
MTEARPKNLILRSPVRQRCTGQDVEEGRRGDDRAQSVQSQGEDVRWTPPAAVCAPMDRREVFRVVAIRWNASFARFAGERARLAPSPMGARL